MLMDSTNKRKGETQLLQGSWVSPFCLYIKIWHTRVYSSSLCYFSHWVICARLSTSEEKCRNYFAVYCMAHYIGDENCHTVVCYMVDSLLSCLREIWYMPGDCRSFHQDCNPAKMAITGSFRHHPLTPQVLLLLHALWKVWYVPGDCRSFHQDCNLAEIAVTWSKVSIYSKTI